jgi:hypothetical protein
MTLSSSRQGPARRDPQPVGLDMLFVLTVALLLANRLQIKLQRVIAVPSRMMAG